ncbi:MAG: uracil-DNA glycosylase family protein [Gemmatimonadaceae bacterium]
MARHRDALAACRACGNDDPAALPVLSLARRARVMLVGQAPGKTETVDRRPFAGRAGKTLFRWLDKAGVSEEEARERIYIAAVTRCYPGASPSGRGDRVPTPREQQLCGGWLESELRLMRPSLIVPVGRLAINRFIGARPLDQVIGKEHHAEHGGGSSVVIPLPHPSGASSWIHGPGHAELVDGALALLRSRLAQTLYL